MQEKELEITSSNNIRGTLLQRGMKKWGINWGGEGGGCAIKRQFLELRNNKWE